MVTEAEKTAAGPPSGRVAGRSERLRRALPIALVLLVAVVLRLAHWAAVRRAPFVAQLVMDSQEYDRWAREIAAGDWLGHGVFFQAPLYPYLLGLVYAAFGRSLDVVYLLQIACGVAGCYALYRSGEILAGRRTGLAAAALAAVYGPFLFYDVQLLKESLAASVTAFLLWALLVGWEGGGRRARAVWFGVGGLLGALALLRENALLLAPVMVLLAWWANDGGRNRAASAAVPAGAVPPPAPVAEAASGEAPVEVAGDERLVVATGGQGDPGRRWVPAARRSLAFAAGLALVLAPVALRNRWVGGDFLPTTFQGGTNFYIGNNPRADGTYRPIVPGKQVPELERREPARLAEQRLGRPLSPAGVSRYWLGQGLAWAGAHPVDFLRLQWRKVGLFWSWYEWPDAVDYYQIREQSPVFRLPLLEFGGASLLAAVGLAGLALRMGRARRMGRAGAGEKMEGTLAEPEAGGDGDAGMARRYVPVLVFAAGWMAVTVVFFLFARYRLPVVPALLLVAALPVAALAPATAGAWNRRRVGLAAALAVAFLLPHLLGFAPRLDLVRFNLGRLAEERGDREEARREYEGVLAVAPGDFLAWLDLGDLAARRRDWPEALRCFSRAAELEPASDDAQSNLGGVYLALDQPDAAAHHLAQALALNPRSVQALHNSSLLHLRQGDLASARALNEQVLALDPANPAARRLQMRLASGLAR